MQDVKIPANSSHREILNRLLERGEPPPPFPFVEWVDLLLVVVAAAVAAVLKVKLQLFAAVGAVDLPLVQHILVQADDIISLMAKYVERFFKCYLVIRDSCLEFSV